jgi:nifR3 family TIM-barrel protein
MRIGSVPIGGVTVLAPLAGITNLPFRLLVKEQGCGLVCSEMISANGLHHGSPKTVRLMESVPEEKPLSVQIFGSDPAIMAEAARMVADSGADILDINFGCSVRKVVKTGAGAALMRRPQESGRMLRAVRDAVDIPLTVKIRSGWDATGDQALTLARVAEDCGVDAVAVHPRTATQGFGGCADWTLIRRVKGAVSIPVIGNGDIETPADALRMLDTTGCDLVMVGRAAIGYPWIFSRIEAAVAGRPVPEVTPAMRIAAMARYLDDTIRAIGEVHACRMMRSRLGWFAKGRPNASQFRASLHHLSSRAEALERIEGYGALLSAS